MNEMLKTNKYFFMRKIFFISIIFSLIFLPCCSKQNNLKPQKQINRIVSLGASATEILFALDAQDKIVARTDFCDYPEQAKSIKSIGGFDGKSISLESIILCEPDFVYLFATMHDHLIKPLEDLGIKVYVSNANSIEQIKAEILEVGKIIDKEKQAQKVVEQMNQKLNSVTKYVAEKKSKSSLENIKVFWQVWDSPLMTVGKNSFINDIINYCGVTNIFENEISAYPIVTKEAVIYENPDFIFFTSSEKLTQIKKTELKSFNPKYGVYDVGDRDIFSRSTPRVVNAIEELSKIIWETVE